jgi:hypothetical protein
MMGVSSRIAFVATCVLLYFVATSSCSGTGCSRTRTAELAPPVGAPDGAGFESNVTFEILSPGAEPRRPLRHVWHVGMHELARLESKTTQQTTKAGVRGPVTPQPGVILHTVLSTAAQLPNEHYLQHDEVTGLDLVKEPGIDPSMMAAQDAVMSRRVGTVVDEEVTPEGRTVRSIRRFPVDMDPEDVDELDQLARAERGGSVPFPPDPLGDGAQLRATKTTHERGITSEGAFGVTVVHREGDVVTLEWTFELHATVDPAENPPNPGRKLGLRSMTANGHGSRTQDLASLVPIREEVDSVMETTFDVAGQPEPVSATRTRHATRRREIRMAALVQVFAGALALLVLSWPLPRWLRGKSAMPYRVSHVARWLLVALGLGGVVGAWLGDGSAEAFVAIARVLACVTVASAAYVLAVLYRWRWRATEPADTTSPPFR